MTDAPSPLPPSLSSSSFHPPSSNGHAAHPDGSAHSLHHALAGPSRLPADGISAAAQPMYADVLPALDRGEFVRLSIQALRDCGYLDAARTLEQESGFAYELAPVEELRAAVRGGRWEEAGGLLEAVGILGSPHATRARFLLEEQKYLELLETGQTKKALVTLRTGLAPLAFDPERLHRLSSYMLCITRDDLLSRSSWDGASGLSRASLLAQLESFIPPSLALPPRRLHTLLSQALAYQRLHAPYRAVAPAGAETLFADASGERRAFPLRVGARRDVGGEVWNVAWSRDGGRLAAVGTKRDVVVYRVTRDASSSKSSITMETTLPNAHDDPISNVSWSPDGLVLATSAEERIKLWDTTSWVCIKEITEHAELVSTVRWLPNSSGLFTSGEDGKLCHFDRAGTLLSTTTPRVRMFDFDFTPDASRLVGVGTFARESVPVIGGGGGGGGSSRLSGASAGRGAGEASGGYQGPRYQLVVMDLPERTVVECDCPIIPGEVTSFKLSRDGQTALLNRHPHELQVWSFAAVGTAGGGAPRLVKRLHGHWQSQFYVRGCFAGPEDNLVISGSEDSRVYVWHLASGELLEVLEGHKQQGAVNAVAWRPTDGENDSAAGPQAPMFASCGDDGHVIFWEPVGPDDTLPAQNLADANQAYWHAGAA